MGKIEKDFDPDELHYETLPVITIGELQRCVEIDTQRKFQTEFRQLLFGDNYINDVYLKYYFLDDVEYHEGYSWQNPTQIEEINLVNRFLRVNFGLDYDSILIDVSW